MISCTLPPAVARRLESAALATVKRRGALSGLLFVLICTYGEQHIVLAWPAAFSVWQIPVGLSLAAFGRTPN